MANPQVGARMRPPTPNDSRHVRSRFGHGVGFSTDVAWQEARLEVTLGAEIVAYLAGPHRAVLSERYGEVAGREVGMGHGLLFPNLGFLSTGTLRQFLPKGPNTMEIWNYQMVPKAASAELKRRWRVSSVNAFVRAASSSRTTARTGAKRRRRCRARVRRSRLNFQMGLGRGRADGTLPG